VHKRELCPPRENDYATQRNIAWHASTIRNTPSRQVERAWLSHGIAGQLRWHSLSVPSHLLSVWP